MTTGVRFALTLRMNMIMKYVRRTTKDVLATATIFSVQYVHLTACTVCSHTTAMMKMENSIAHKIKAVPGIRCFVPLCHSMRLLRCIIWRFL